ncbi:hypothetical protein N7448_008988 [Penicillium atrosanguineum]|uniref:uncharacterized protein n=1 Tax=Penicillium atrosanguineum TaxID=1132637 RepID=UPI0023A59837|nr:uncharacterized protein N7443_006235 [Penicillium atrosanguineum]KAJ5122891.1 hypothetical protein N7448_008988 [Penicillium atrosanguineum]KAJ5298115.1 hypothetical protein N7443_006235 [Penicillium atrosanguineum]
MVPKTIIVTGASRGLGLAMAKYLLSAPQRNNVVAVARSLEPLQKLKSQFDDQVQILAGDLRLPSTAQDAVAIALQSFGAIDGLILNHGVLGQIGNISVAEVDQWKQGFEINFFSSVNFIKVALPALRESKGRIVFTSSGAVTSASRGWAMYAATKAAINNLTQSLGAEESDVICLAIEPGMVNTEMQRELREEHISSLDAEMHSKFTSVHQTSDLLEPEQPGHVMARLALGAPRSLSGQFLSWNDPALQQFSD